MRGLIALLLLVAALSLGLMRPIDPPEEEVFGYWLGADGCAVEFVRDSEGRFTTRNP